MGNLITAKVASNKLRDELSERIKNPGYIWGTPYGFDKLDRLTGGIQKGEMCILIARPGVGKSAFAGKIALNVAQYLKQQKSDKVVRIVSLEMDFLSWQKRLACFISGVSISKINSGFATPEQVEMYTFALDELAALPIECLDTASNLDGIVRFIRYNSITKREVDSNCAFWVLDHIGIVPGQDPTHAASSLAQISNTFRDLCKEVAPALVLSQMNRKAEERQDKRPTTADVYGSDYMLQNARRMLGLYREDIYLKLSEEERKQPQPAELLILKANNGQLGTIDMIYNPTRLDWSEAPV